MSLKYGLLGLLNYKNMTGYDLDKAFKASLDFFWHGQTSQIYRELTAMEKAGWLSSEIEIQTSKPNRKVYSITKKGRDEFMKWLSPSLESGEKDKSVKDALHVQSSFNMKIFFSGELKPEQTAFLLQSFREECRAALEKMNAVPDNISNYSKMINKPEAITGWRMTAFLGKSYYKFCEKWAEEMLKMLEDV
ncbi:MAG: PadR family transcriptional regulator [Treponema sp.]|nr:PadR family transcriptional regulator [Treponema sp.]MCL2272730.1 PadR family transcriptional regulator [Treponema sp.]